MRGEGIEPPALFTSRRCSTTELTAQYELSLCRRLPPDQRCVNIIVHGNRACDASIAESFSFIILQESPRLMGPEMRVCAAFPQERVVRAILDYLAVVHNENAVHFPQG